MDNAKSKLDSHSSVQSLPYIDKWCSTSRSRKSARQQTNQIEYGWLTAKALEIALQFPAHTSGNCEGEVAVAPTADPEDVADPKPDTLDPERREVEVEMAEEAVSEGVGGEVWIVNNESVVEESCARTATSVSFEVALWIQGER